MDYEIISTPNFDKWFDNLKNRTTKNKILARIDRIKHGNFGDSKPLGKHLGELRFFFGAGIRVYYTVRGNQLVLLLNGGDKSSQSKDIKKANQIMNELE